MFWYTQNLLMSVYDSNSHGSLNRRLPEMVNRIHGSDSVTDTVISLCTKNTPH